MNWTVPPSPPVTVAVSGRLKFAYGLPAAVGEVITQVGGSKSAVTIFEAVQTLPVASVAVTVTV